MNRRTSSVIITTTKNVAVVVDTSGSMSEHMLGEVIAEVEGILRGVGLGREQLPVVIEDALADPAIANTPRPPTADEIGSILGSVAG